MNEYSETCRKEGQEDDSLKIQNRTEESKLTPYEMHFRGDLGCDLQGLTYNHNIKITSAPYLQTQCIPTDGGEEGDDNVFTER